MPSTDANTAIDHVRRERPAVIDHLVKYATTDLLCYRAEGPAELRDRQQDSWQPLLDWAQETFRARLTVTDGIVPVEQPAVAVAKLKTAVEELDDVSLAALASLTTASGSLVIGLALVHGHIDAKGAVEASELDERWQNEKWGEDEEEIKRRDEVKSEIENAVKLLDLIGG
jgi:chaperone required for assembly of F1-ATPase